jgi:DNA repair exonuclease SbcCD ATPase subunit
MIAGGGGRPSDTADGMTFSLERFAWGAPDRLEVSGTFAGMHDPPPDAPELVVRGRERIHRLRALPDRVSGPPEDGELWWAEFAWQEPPEAFDGAELQFGGAFVVELPALDDLESSTELAVQSREPAQPAGAERLRLEAQLLASQEEVRELRAAADRLQEELTRARDDLRAEHERHEVDAERFREGLARVQRSAEDAIAEAQGAIQERDAALEQARAEAEALRGQRAGVDDARRAADEARADLEAMVGRLTAIRDALGDGGT